MSSKILKEQQINLIDWLNSAIKEQYLNHGLSTSVMLIFGAMVKKKNQNNLRVLILESRFESI